MADPFAAALRAIHNSPLGEAATYVPRIGASVALRVTVSLQMAEFGKVRPHRARTGRIINIMREDVETPAVGDAIYLADGPFVLTVPPELDAEGLTWICDVPALDRSVVILKRTDGQDTHGDVAATFMPLAPLAAAKVETPLPEADGNSVTGNQITARVRATFLLAWSEIAAAVTPRDRLECEGSAYEIEAVTEVGTRMGVEIVTTARVG